MVPAEQERKVNEALRRESHGGKGDLTCHPGIARKLRQVVHVTHAYISNSWTNDLSRIRLLQEDWAGGPFIRMEGSFRVVRHTHTHTLFLGQIVHPNQWTILCLFVTHIFVAVQVVHFYTNGQTVVGLATGRVLMKID